MQRNFFRFCDLMKQKYYYLVNLNTFYGACDSRYKQASFRASRNVNSRLHSMKTLSATGL